MVSLTWKTHVDPVEISGSFRNLQLGWRLPSGRDLQTDQSGRGRPVQCGRPQQLHRHRRHHRQEIRPRLTTVSVNVLLIFIENDNYIYLFGFIYSRPDGEVLLRTVSPTVIGTCWIVDYNDTKLDFVKIKYEDWED